MAKAETISSGNISLEEHECPAFCQHSGTKLPGGWECAWDENHNRHYFYNHATQERTWLLEKKFDAQRTHTFDANNTLTSYPQSASNSPRERKKRAAHELWQLQNRANEAVVKELDALSKNLTTNMTDICDELRRIREVAPSTSALHASSEDKLASKWIQKRNEFRKRKSIVALRGLLVNSKLDPDGKHCREELEKFASKEDVRGFFEDYMKVDPLFPLEVFDILNMHGDNKVSMKEFIEGCVELKHEPIVREEIIHSCSISTSKATQLMSESLLRANPKPCKRIQPLTPYVDVAGSPDLPGVEIAIRVNHLANVDTNNLTFQVDLTVFLDWVDERIPDEVTEADELDWEMDFFNPVVVIEGTEKGYSNLGECQPFFEQADGNADVQAHKKQELWCYRNGRRCKWCSKACRFHGTLSMPEVDLRLYPFDDQLLPLKFRTKIVSFGAVLHAPVSLIETQIRRHTREYNSCRATFRYEGCFCASTPTGRCMADSMVEFSLWGLYSFIAFNLLEPKYDGKVFQVTIIVRRPVLGHQLGEFAVLLMLTTISAVSFWDTASPELSSRMSITLTIILTLAAYTSQRPAAIEKVPYTTVQDIFELVGMGLVSVVCILNVIAVVLCGGESEEAPIQMQERYEHFRDSLCVEASSVAMRTIDWIGFLIFMIGVFVSVVVFSWYFKYLHLNVFKEKLRENVELWTLTEGRGVESIGTGTAWCEEIDKRVFTILREIKKERFRASNFLRGGKGDARVAPELIRHETKSTTGHLAPMILRPLAHGLDFRSD